MDSDALAGSIALLLGGQLSLMRVPGPAWISGTGSDGDNWRHCENSEVSGGAEVVGEVNCLGLVAVAVMNWPKQLRLVASP